MQPRSFVKLPQTVFQVTKSGDCSILEGAGFSSPLDLRPREKKEERDEDLEETSLGAEDEELMDGTDEELAVAGLGTRSRLKAAGRCGSLGGSSSIASSSSSSSSPSSGPSLYFFHSVST
jgi:hypothetical protein